MDFNKSEMVVLKKPNRTSGPYKITVIVDNTRFSTIKNEIYIKIFLIVIEFKLKKNYMIIVMRSFSMLSLVFLNFPTTIFISKIINYIYIRCFERENYLFYRDLPNLFAEPCNYNSCNKDFRIIIFHIYNIYID